MKVETILSLVLLAGACIFAACEITQTTNPSPVDVTITQPSIPTEPTSPTDPTGPSGTIALDPAGISVSVGSTAYVKVVVRDENGSEVPSENISVNVIDKTIIRLTEIDGRILAFSGLAAGTTSVIVSASGLQTSLVATVTP